MRVAMALAAAPVAGVGVQALGIRHHVTTTLRSLVPAVQAAVTTKQWKIHVAVCLPDAVRMAARILPG